MEQGQDKVKDKVTGLYIKQFQVNSYYHQE